MRNRLKRYFRETFPSVAWFLGKSPGDWIFCHAVLKWMFESALREQLPLPYRIFSAYCRLYFTITGRAQLRGGRQLFYAVSGLSGLLSSRDYIRLKLPDYEVYLDSADPRFLQVVNVLTSDQSDTQVLSALLSEGDTFIDVGANHGSYSIVASRLVGIKGCVVSIEPQPHLARAIEKSLASNALCSSQVHQIAVGDCDGEVELLIPCDTSGSAGIYPAYSGLHRHRKVKVPLRRFDEAVDWQTLPGKTLIKLDVEGSELAFLKGARRMIASLKPSLLIEIHPHTLKASGRTGEELKCLLIELGYKRYAEFRTLEETFPIEHMETRTEKNVVVFMTSVT
jgi:FkbM family methyltransferase